MGRLQNLPHDCEPNEKANRIGVARIDGEEFQRDCGTGLGLISPYTGVIAPRPSDELCMTAVALPGTAECPAHPPINQVLPKVDRVS